MSVELLLLRDAAYNALTVAGQAFVPLAVVLLLVLTLDLFLTSLMICPLSATLEPQRLDIRRSVSLDTRSCREAPKLLVATDGCTNRGARRAMLSDWRRADMIWIDLCRRSLEIEM